MNSQIKTHALLAASLAALFISGMTIGRLTAPGAPVAATPAETRSWAQAASGRLAADLELDTVQQQQADKILATVSRAIDEDKEKALFTMYLRMLRVHDAIDAGVTLSAAQSARLSASRARLKSLILERFPQRVSQDPLLALDPSTGN
ncbi:MAG: hypothetical protein ACO3JG_06555 [Luteolibacter sp.]